MFGSSAPKALKSRNCFITGAASGIGRATAIAAAKESAVLFLTDRNEALLGATVREIREAGGVVVASRALDITDVEAVRAFADDIHAEAGSMDARRE